MNNSMKNFTAFVFILGMLSACNAASNTNKEGTARKSVIVESHNKNSFSINSNGTTILSRFEFDKRVYERPYNTDYANWLLNRELYPDGHKTRYYDMDTKWKSVDVAAAVLTYDLVGTFSNGVEKPADLQQCADACIRLWAEYLWEKKMYDKIHFKNAPGFVFSYKKWAEGYRVHFDKKWNASWSKDAGVDYGRTTFRKYLSLVFMYCGTATLAKELQKVKSTDIQPGDILIWGGRPGHAVTVMDVIRNKQTGKIKVMFSQSYMPAQEIEILANGNDNGAPWFDIDEAKYPVIRTPEWTFDLSNGSKFVRWVDR